MYVCMYATFLSATQKIIKRPGKETAATDGAQGISKDAYDMHDPISIHKKHALKTQPGHCHI